ncbi:hypothetical protein SUNI508_13485 [Seiridium unicorne]|uniref:DUF1996 domain-containing protein n=1 Tax=Seiridium unicorne TaxID=138068 RepID=A0ABR2VE07_9PEZI
MLRLGCPRLVIDRLDPLINPGAIHSPHIHRIVGGNGFNASMTTSDVSATATCTTCEFSEDFSNYWTANLYFKVRNGTYKRVQQRGAALQFSDTYSNKMADGILVYYVSAQPGSITAFKPGFRMLVGDPNQRSRPNTRLKHQNFYRCYTGPNYGPISLLLAKTTGRCLSLSSPRPHPAADHADYVFGWKGDALEKAMNATNCMGADLKTQQLDAGTKCGVKRVVDEDHDGWIKELPGMTMPM